MTINTFSGTHPFDPTVLADTDAHEQGTAEQIVEDINDGRCPRCWGPLPTMPEFPAGSRITKCRSIPICGRCGWDEVCEQLDADADIGWGLSSAGCWPLSWEEIEERHDRHQGQMKPAILTADGQLITDDGVFPVMNPCNTGGWAQYGRADGDGDDAA